MNTTGKTCANCFFGESIDMAANRYKCHVSRPTANAGFPKVRASDFCSYWTDPKTMDRPFFYLLPNAVDLYRQRPTQQTTIKEA